MYIVKGVIYIPMLGNQAVLSSSATIPYLDVEEDPRQSSGGLGGAEKA